MLQLHITYWSEKKDEDLPELESMVLKRGGTYRLLVYPFSLSSSGVGIPELKKKHEDGGVQTISLSKEIRETQITYYMY